AVSGGASAPPEGMPLPRTHHEEESRDGRSGGGRLSRAKRSEAEAKGASVGEPSARSERGRERPSGGHAPPADPPPAPDRGLRRSYRVNTGSTGVGLVAEERLELSRPFSRQILSLLCLPVPPLSQRRAIYRNGHGPS